jgi:phytoene/squalene synthetase
VQDLDDRRMTEPWQRVLTRVAARTRQSFEAGRDVCDGVRGRLRHELRATWLGGTRVLDRLERINYDVFTIRPSLGLADVPSLALRALFWRRA